MIQKLFAFITWVTVTTRKVMALLVDLLDEALLDVVDLQRRHGAEEGGLDLEGPALQVRLGALAVVVVVLRDQVEELECIKYMKTKTSTIARNTPIKEMRSISCLNWFYNYFIIRFIINSNDCFTCRFVGNRAIFGSF